MAKMSDAEIRQLVRQGMHKRPQQTTVMRIRNGVVLTAMGIAIYLLMTVAKWQIGSSLASVGIAATVLLMIWNLVWVNKVLYPLTQEELAS